jgi:radical SAM-linked protein
MTQAEGTVTVFRIRLVSARHEALRYVSHLDMQLVWERTLRRAGIPLAHSQGFNPRPRMHMASALPLGFTSRCEITDFWMEPAPGEAPDLQALSRQIQAAAPPGLEILQADNIPLNLPALQTQVQASEFRAKLLDPLDFQELSNRIHQILAAETLPRERRGKPYDLRPLVFALEAHEMAGGAPEIFMHLSARESATGRPEEVLDALGLDPSACRVERTALFLS